MKLHNYELCNEHHHQGGRLYKGDLVVHQHYNNEAHVGSNFFPTVPGVVTRCFTYEYDVLWQDGVRRPRFEKNALFLLLGQKS